MRRGRMRPILLFAAGAAALAAVWCGTAVSADSGSEEGGRPVRSQAGQGDRPMPHHGTVTENGAPSLRVEDIAGSDARVRVRSAAPGEHVAHDVPDMQTEPGGLFRGYLVVSAAFLVIYSLGFWLIQVRRHMPGKRE